MSRKNKFDLAHLAHSGYVKDGDQVYFVSDEKLSAVIAKQPNGDYKLKIGKETITVFAAAQKFLGQEPPDHASKWLKLKSGKTLFELWQLDQEEAMAA